MIMAGLTEPEQLEGDHLAWGHVGELSLAQWWAYKNPGWQLNTGGEIAYEDTSLPFPNQATFANLHAHTTAEWCREAAAVLLDVADEMDRKNKETTEEVSTDG